MHQNSFDSYKKQQPKSSILAAVEEPLQQSLPNLSSMFPAEEFPIRELFSLRWLEILQKDIVFFPLFPFVILWLAADF